MAEKQEKKTEEKPAAPAAAPAPAKAEEKKPAAGGGLLRSTPVLLGVAMIVEAAVLFAGFKVLGGGPKAAAGADLVKEEGGGGDAHGGGGGGHDDGHGGGEKPAKAKGKFAEISVLEAKFPNKQSGRMFLYDVSIQVSVKSDCVEKIEAAIKDRKATVIDRIRTIIAQSDPEKLGGGSEPGLETLKRQVRHQLDELVGEGMIEEVLVPRCIPYRQEF